MKALTEQESGIIIMAAMLLFPTASMLYGGYRLYFAAKQAAMRKFREDKEKARKQGRSEGHSEGLVEGRSEGLIEGRSEGLVEGRSEGLIEGRSKGLVEGRSEGLIEGRSIERTRIMNELSRRGALTPELLQILSSEDDEDRS